MSDIIKDPTLISALQELARGVKSERDLAALTQDLLKITVEASLNAEMDDHLGYPKHSPEGYAMVPQQSQRLRHQKAQKRAWGDRD